jgi:molybdopterin-binding protein
MRKDWFPAQHFFESDESGSINVDCILRPIMTQIQKEEHAMKYGAQNQIKAKVSSVKKGDIMSLIKFTVTAPSEMASVITTESAESLGLKVGDEVQLIVKAIHVLPVKP